MEVAEIRGLRAELTEFLGMFDDCFRFHSTAEHVRTYVQGQLSDIPRKSVEPMALRAGIRVRTLQNFLSVLAWDQTRLRDRLAEIVVREQAHEHTVGIIDETSDDKKGRKTPGVQRQWCGSTGKMENCVVTVHLAYATPEFHCLLDGDLFLPESWAEDRERCREAGIPDEVGYRTKWQIALDLYDRARSNGVTFRWLTFDEWYGAKPEFLRGLSARQQLYVGEVPRALWKGWIDAPATTARHFRRNRRGKGRKTPRVKAGAPAALTVENMRKYHPKLRDQEWVRYRIKDGQKGPIIWEAKRVMFTAKDENKLPGERLHLVVARNPLDGEIKYFVSNAPADEKIETLLLVAFSRWKVERCFEDQKGEVGLDHYEGRTWVGLMRHLVLSSMSYLFLSRVHQRLREKKSGADGVPGGTGCLGLGAVLVA